MPVDKKLIDTAASLEAQGKSSAEILDLIKSSQNYADVGAKIDSLRGNMKDDEIYGFLKTATVASPSPSAASENKPSVISRMASGTVEDVTGIAKGVYNIVTHPFQTVDALRTYVIGAGGALRKATGMQENPYATPQQKAEGKESFASTEQSIAESIKNPAGVPKRALNYAIDHPVNAALNLSMAAGGAGKVAEGAGMANTAKALSTVEKYSNPITGPIAVAQKVPLEKIAERTYASAAKMSLAKKWTQTLPGREMSDRLAATKAGIKSRTPVSDYGIAKATKLEEEAKAAVDSIVNTATASGARMPTGDLLKGLDKAYEMAANSSDPRGVAKVIDRFAEKFMNRADTLNPNEVLAVKRQLYKEIKSYTGKFENYYKSANQGLAHEAMIALESLNPELHTLNATDAAYIKLKEALQAAVARESNKDIIGLGAKVLTNKSIVMAVVEQTVGHPQVKSRLAFALDKVAKMKPNPMTTTLMLQTAKTAGAVDTDNAEAGVLSDYAQGVSDKRKQAIDQATGANSVDIPQAQAASASSGPSEAQIQEILARAKQDKGKSNNQPVYRMPSPPKTGYVKFKNESGQDRWMDSAGDVYKFDPGT